MQKTSNALTPLRQYLAQLLGVFHPLPLWALVTMGVRSFQYQIVQVHSKSNAVKGKILKADLIFHPCHTHSLKANTGLTADSQIVFSDYACTLLIEVRDALWSLPQACLTAGVKLCNGYFEEDQKMNTWEKSQQSAQTVLTFPQVNTQRVWRLSSYEHCAHHIKDRYSLKIHDYENLSQVYIAIYRCARIEV